MDQYGPSQADTNGRRLVDHVHAMAQAPATQRTPAHEQPDRIRHVLPAIRVPTLISRARRPIAPSKQAGTSRSTSDRQAPGVGLRRALAVLRRRRSSAGRGAGISYRCPYRPPPDARAPPASISRPDTRERPADNRQVPVDQLVPTLVAGQIGVRAGSRGFVGQRMVASMVSGGGRYGHR